MGTHKAIYQPKGAAREYSAWACNLYNGCTNQCDYCYCKRGVLSYTLGLSKPVLKKTVGKDDKEAFETFKRELAMYKDNIINDGTGLFFSFSTDPMLLEELPLTTLCVNECVKNGGASAARPTTRVSGLHRVTVISAEPRGAI